MAKTYSEFVGEAYLEQVAVFPAALIRKLAVMVDDNQHTEAYILVANELQKAKNNSGNQYARRFKTIKAISDKEGHLPNHYVKLTNDFLNSMKDEVFRTFKNAEAVWKVL